MQNKLDAAEAVIDQTKEDWDEFYDVIGETDVYAEYAEQCY
mgnify:CR=1 FL=1